MFRHQSSASILLVEDCGDEIHRHGGHECHGRNNAQLNNMRDIVKSLTEQVDGLRDAVAQSESARNQAKFEVEGYLANMENARIALEQYKTLLAENSTSQRDYDNKNDMYQSALAQLSGAKAHVNQSTAELERSKADLDKSIADLGAPGEANPRLLRAEAGLELAQQNLNFTKVWAPVDGYITNLQLRRGDSAVANQPSSGWP
jgi:multidrug resistance efflux pump